MIRFALAILPLATILASALAEGADSPPSWAYPITPAGFKPAPGDGIPRQVPYSSATYTLTQLRDRFIASDWHPEDHQPLPLIVAQGSKPDVFACGFCHRADGPGGPENSALAGLPAAYIVQQMNDFRSGARTTAVPKRGVQMMVDLAKAATDEEIAAAEWLLDFSAQGPQRVKMRRTQCERICPPCPTEQTSLRRAAPSLMGQQPTLEAMDA